MATRFVPLGSGSQGNATLVEVGSTRLLVDAGLSARSLERRLATVGVAAAALDYILLSHEHHDHARGARRFSRNHGVPLVCAAETLAALDWSPAHLAGWQPFEPGRSLQLGAARVEPFAVPHDAARPVGFVIEGADVRFGLVTDLGHATALVVERLRGCDVLLIEANHDDRMLRDGPYPWRLKQRVGGRLGHLSNDEAAALLRRVAGPSCRAVVLGHLSEQNNTPQRALAAARRAAAAAGRRDLEIRVAARDAPSAPLHVRARQPGLFG